MWLGWLGCAVPLAVGDEGQGALRAEEIAESPEGSWTVDDEYFSGWMRFQNDHWGNDDGGELELWGLVELTVTLDQDGAPIADGLCATFRDPDRDPSSAEWSAEFAGVPLVQEEDGRWSGSRVESYGGASCDPWVGEKICGFSIFSSGRAKASIDYRLEPHWDGTCAVQSRSLSMWGLSP